MCPSLDNRRIRDGKVMDKKLKDVRDGVGNVIGKNWIVRCGGVFIIEGIIEE